MSGGEPTGPPFRSVVLWSQRFPRSPHSFMASYTKGLADLGVEVTVVSTHDDDRPADPDRSGADVIQTPWEAPVADKLRRTARLGVSALRSNPSDTIRLVGRVARRHRAPRSSLSALFIDLPMLVPAADLIHIGWFDGAVFMNELLEVSSAPTVVSCHGSDLLLDMVDERHRRGVLDVLARVDVVHCVSDDLRRVAVGVGVDPDRIVTGHWGVDTELFAPVRRSVDGPLHVVTTARLDPVKGLRHGLEAVAIARDRGVDIRYTIVGGRVYDVPVDDVYEAIESHGLSDVVEITGWCPLTEVRRHLVDADVFMLPSLSEGLATAMLEAMSTALPVVVTDVGGLSEAVTDGVEGRLVPPRDPEALADALVEMDQDRDAALTMGRRGREQVVANHDSFDAARALLDGFASVL